MQFYCVAASGPQLARLADLPHVATVVAGTDAEGVARLIATVEAIATERDKMFTTQRLDMDKVRAVKFGSARTAGRSPPPRCRPPRAVSGGEVVLVIDGWKNFTETYPDLATRCGGADAGPQLRRAGGLHAHQLDFGAADAGEDARRVKRWSSSWSTSTTPLSSATA